MAAVLTAAHCCLAYAQGKGNHQGPGQDTWQTHEWIRVVISAHHLNWHITSPYAGDQMPEVTTAWSDRVWVHPEYVATDGSVESFADVCVIDLKESVPENVGPASLGNCDYNEQRIMIQTACTGS